MYEKNLRPVSIIHSRKFNSCREDCSWSSQEYCAWGSDINNGYLLENYWITKLRQLTERVIRNCFWCKRFQVKPFATPPQSQLPIDRTTGSRPFHVIVTDFTGPITYCAKIKKGEKDCTFFSSPAV